MSIPAAVRDLANQRILILDRAARRHVDYFKNGTQIFVAFFMLDGASAEARPLVCCGQTALRRPQR
jgi:hypothetical protein